MARAKSGAVDTWAAVRNAALALPAAWEDYPGSAVSMERRNAMRWGEVVVKVNKRIFVFLGRPESDQISITVKLTASHDHALSVPGAAPAGYGSVFSPKAATLTPWKGNAGWVTVPIEPVDADLLQDWVEESYRNVAPKKLAAQLDVAEPKATNVADRPQPRSS
jgi:predicted DNA-binding protein (MmcQ/YjbR family)